jgi:predicted dehydrogenase
VDRAQVAVIGCGYWGPNLVRTFSEMPTASVAAVADLDRVRLDEIRLRHPHIETLVEDYTAVLGRDLDAAIVCTPPETHHKIVRACLEHGLDVLVEKPLATSTAQAQDLVDVAEARGRILMVGHIGAYNPAVSALRDMVRHGALGQLAYIDAVRVGLGLFHSVLNVLWDLAPHDVAIFLHLLDESPTSVSTRGIACIEPSIEDVAYMTLTFPSGVLAHARMSWLDPCKTRRITVVGREKMVVYDDLESHEKLRIHDKSVEAVRRTDTFGEFQFAYHYGSVVSPYVRFDEPLRIECQHFVDCLTGRATPLTDGRNGVEVVRVIEAAQQSLRQGGIPVPIPIPTTIDPRRLTQRRALSPV